MRAALLAAAAVGVACGGATAPARGPSALAAEHAASASDRLVGLLPPGAQVIVEIDLARLRANGVVGPVITRALADIALDTDVALPMKLPSTPLATASTVVLAAYGVGTAQAATVTLLGTAEDVPGGQRVAPGVIALGPDEWVGQIATRAAIAGDAALAPTADTIALRDHAMPAGATGAAVRVTARLTFDARVALARQTGVATAPAQLSLWADVADDLVVVIDADAGREPPKKLAATLRGVLTDLADASEVRALGLPQSLVDARQIRQGTWIRTIVAVGPTHLKRVAARATALLPAEGSAAGSAS